MALLLPAVLPAKGWGLARLCPERSTKAWCSGCTNWGCAAMWLACSMGLAAGMTLTCTRDTRSSLDLAQRQKRSSEATGTSATQRGSWTHTAKPMRCEQRKIEAQLSETVLTAWYCR